jgi:hypothetical protein
LPATGNSFLIAGADGHFATIHQKRNAPQRTGEGLPGINARKEE